MPTTDQAVHELPRWTAQRAVARLPVEPHVAGGVVAEQNVRYAIVAEVAFTDDGIGGEDTPMGCHCAGPPTICQ